MRLIIYALFACNLAFLVTDIVRSHYASGTRGRYVFTTVVWALLPLAFPCPFLLILAGTIGGNKFTLISGIFNFAMVMWVFYDLYKGDDDNWFKRKRKQLKRYLSSLRLRQAQLAGSRA